MADFAYIPPVEARQTPDYSGIGKSIDNLFNSYFQGRQLANQSALLNIQQAQEGRNAQQFNTGQQLQNIQFAQQNPQYGGATIGTVAGQQAAMQPGATPQNQIQPQSLYAQPPAQPVANPSHNPSNTKAMESQF